MQHLKRDLMIAFCAVLAVGFLVGFEVGCRTVTQNPDGSIETTEIDPVALDAFLQVGLAILEYKEAHVEPDTPDPDLAEVMVEIVAMREQVRAIGADGKLDDQEIEQLVDLYEQAHALLRGEGVKISEK